MMNPNSFTIIYGTKTVPISLPTTLKELKEIASSIFGITNQKFMYKESNDIIEIESEQDYQEFYAIAPKLKYIVVGENEGSFAIAADIIKSNPLIDQFMLVDSLSPSEINKTLEKNILAKPETTEQVTNAIVEQKDKSANATIKMNEIEQQMEPLKIDDNSKAICPCFLCYGNKINKKGKPCKRCKGTGSISQEDYNILKKIVAEEAKECVGSMIEEVKSSLMSSIRMSVSKEESQEQPMKVDAKEVAIVKPQNIPVSCLYCMSPFKECYMACIDCQVYLCENCASQNFHNHPLKKIYSSIYQEAPKAPELAKLINKVISTSCSETIYVRPGQETVGVFIFQNLGAQWPANTALYYSNGDNICANQIPFQCNIGATNSNQVCEAKVAIKSPMIAGKYTAYFRMGYTENSGIVYFGEKPWITIEVKIDDTYEGNLKKLTDMGYSRDAVISLLKYFNNDLNLVLQYLTSSQYQH